MKLNINALIVLVVLIFACLPGLSQESYRSNWYEAYRPAVIYQELNGDWSMTKQLGDRQNLWRIPDGFNEHTSIPEVNYDASNDGTKPDSKDITLNWYKKSFSLSRDVQKAMKSEQRVFMHFGGVAWQWSAWINGKALVTGNMDALNSYEYDVTEYLNKKGENTLVLAATDNHGMARNLQHGFLFEGTRTTRHGNFIAPTPETSFAPVLWGEVELWCRPENRLEDIFVKPDFRNKQVHLEMDVVGSTDMEVNVEILDMNKQKLPVDFKPVKVMKEKTEVKRIEISAEWQSPRLWNTEDPYLHYANVSLKNPKTGKIIDSQQVRFGFREIWIEGGNIMMNGKRLFIARTSTNATHEHSIDRKSSDLPVKQQLKAYVDQWKANNTLNALRIHRSAFIRPAAFATYTDELGLLLIPESAYCQGDRFDVANPLFWENCNVYLKKWIRAGRNNPSIINWNLTNESLWTGTEKYNPRAPELMYKQEQLVKSIDPSRTVGWDGDWDLAHRDSVGIGPSETVNIHYPCESSTMWWPTDCYNYANVDPSNPAPIRGFYRSFLWKPNSKPIIVGEYSWNQTNYFEAPVNLTKHYGDHIYVFDDYKSGERALRVDRWQADAWRIMRFAGINPWLHRAKGYMSVLPLETIVLKNDPSVYYEGQTIALEAYLLNDKPLDFDYTVKYYLKSGADSISSKQHYFHVVGGEIQAFNAQVNLPIKNRPVNYKLVLELVKNKKIIDHREFDLRSRPNLQLAWPDHVVVYDPLGKTKQLFSDLNIDFKEIDKLTDAEGQKGIVIGASVLESLDFEALKRLNDFVKNGGNVLLMGESNWNYSGFATKATFKGGRANHAWVRSQGHPILKNIEDMDLAYWGNDQWVNTNVFIKPYEGGYNNWRTLVDVGSSEGLMGAVLVELMQGKGRILLNQLHLVKAIQTPGAKALLNNLLTYLADSAPKQNEVSLLLPENSKLFETIRQSGASSVPYDFRNVEYPLFLDAGNKEIDPAQIAQWIKKGGKVWLSSINENNLPRWSKYLNNFTLQKINSFDGATISMQDPLLWGVSNEELFWCKGYWPEWEEKAVNQGRGSKMSKLANISDEEIVCTGENVSKLLSPAVMVKINDGKGIWLLSTINMEEGFSKVKQKTGRFIQAMLSNFNVKRVDVPIEKGEQFTFVSLKDFVNRGFQDDVAQDGKGGWIDRGFKQDLHLFPQNISGIDMANLPMPASGPEDWPSPLLLSGVEFEIIDPRFNNDKTSIVICGDATNKPTKNDNYLKQVKGIPVNKSFENLYSLHTSALTADYQRPYLLWTYVLNYADGTSESIEVQNIIHSGEWHWPKELPSATVAWVGETMSIKPVGLYMARFTNPQPEKVVVSIDIKASDMEGISAIIGITVGTTKN